MGGMETHTITLNKPDVFSYYALLSGGIYTPAEIKDKSKVKLIFLSCGSKERPDGVKNAATALKDAGLMRYHIYLKIPLMNFLPGAAACMSWHRCCLTIKKHSFR